jgi:hypothetical protein
MLVQKRAMTGAGKIGFASVPSGATILIGLTAARIILSDESNIASLAAAPIRDPTSNCAKAYNDCVRISTAAPVADNRNDESSGALRRLATASAR